MHWDFDMYIRNRVDTSPSPVPWSTMCKQLFGFIGFMLFMFYVGEKFPAYQPVVSTHLNARIRFSLFFCWCFFFSLTVTIFSSLKMAGSSFFQFYSLAYRVRRMDPSKPPESYFCSSRRSVISKKNIASLIQATSSVWSQSYLDGWAWIKAIPLN